MGETHRAAPQHQVVVDLEEGPALAAAEPAPAALPAAGVVDLPADGDDTFERLPPHAVRLPDGRVRLPLCHPVTLTIRRGEELRQEVFAELTLRRLTGADMRATLAAGNSASVAALQRSCGIPALKFDALFDRMDAADIAAATQVVGFFLLAGPKTGR